MCGIVAVWNREGVFPSDVYDILFHEAEKRGYDGFGYVVCPKYVKRFTQRYSSIDNLVLPELENNVEIGDVVLAIARAQPETEVDSSDKNMQPIVKEGIALVHNGAVSENVVREYSYLGYETQIDSEAIINAYLANGRDMKRTMENLTGGFAFILYDKFKNRLYCVNDFKPLAIGYFKGYGFIAHSSVEALRKVSELLVGSSRTGLNVWEDYYFHWQDGYTIREIDLDSGMQRIYSYTPNYYHPVWNCKTDNDKELALVICSGGIDSSLTAYILKLAGYEVKLVHFLYGQKGQLAECMAVSRLSEWMGVEVYWIDLSNFYHTLDDPSMLIKSNIEVTTGKEDVIKSTAAWVTARNLIFLTKSVAIAEAEILRENWRKVYIAAGFAQLSEEGFYPDNSEYFIRHFMETVKFGCITGHRIKFLPVFKNIMKYEEWILGSALGFKFEYTVSCDQPHVIDGEIYLCGKCGSDYLSHVASLMAAVKDPRKFMEKSWEIPIKCDKKKHTSPIEIVRRLVLPEDRKKKLLQILSKRGVVYEHTI